MQGGQSRVSVGPANSEPANPSSQQRITQNGAYIQHSSHGMYLILFLFSFVVSVM